MKIHVLDVSKAFQPEYQAFRYPCHNDAYDVEQDFLAFLNGHPELLASKEEADWCYLPIFWTRWHMAHDYASTGLVELQQEASRMLDGVGRAFTVCLYEDGPLVDIGETVLLTATRKTTGIDIPTLCASHMAYPTMKQYRACFVGRLRTNVIRQDMAHALVHRPDVVILDGDFGEGTFVNTMLASNIALCPSGGSGSFRFYEAMQLGVVPLLIHETDTRPFKSIIDWDGCSMYLDSAEDVEAAIDQFDDATLWEMGRRAREVYQEHLTYGKWCAHALREVECASV